MTTGPARTGPERSTVCLLARGRPGPEALDRRALVFYIPPIASGAEAEGGGDDARGLARRALFLPALRRDAFFLAFFFPAFLAVFFFAFFFAMHVS